MSYNIRFGGGGREQRIADVINQANADLVVLQEATDTRIVDRLSELTSMPHRASKRGQSVAFLSRSPVRSHCWQYHPNLQRAILDIDLDGVRVVGVHLRATHSNLTERGRMREIQAALDHVKQFENEFHFLTGDFNTLAPGELLNMQKLPTKYKVLAFLLGGRISFRAIKIMLDAGYLDCYRLYHKDPGFTFPAWDPHVRLDYAFTPAKFAERIKSCAVMTEIPDPAKATDHLPLITEVA
ncbi:MAG: endonuclease/exonuclease/phosphatase family protein [Pyrinomonadaceae bacterium]